MTSVLSVRANACCEQTRARLSKNRPENQQDRVFELPFLSLALALTSQTYQDPFYTTGSRVHSMVREPSPPPADLTSPRGPALLTLQSSDL